MARSVLVGQPRFAFDETLAGLVPNGSGFRPKWCGRFRRCTAVHASGPGGRADRGRAHTLVATGTGSGKTESFLIPVVAHAYRRSHLPGVKAIALYPMNALVNGQEDRVRTACEALGLRYGVYTGATPQHKRVDMQDNSPDILLTNYSMLEFLLTRREDRSCSGRGSCVT